MASDAERNQGSGAYSTPGIDTPALPNAAQILTTLPTVQFKLQQVEPPSPLYIGANDRFMVSVINSDPNVGTVQFNGRLLRAADGQITPFSLSMNVTSDRVPNRQMFDLAEGYLLGCKLVGGGGTTRGRCFAALDLAHGLVANRILFSQLISDYLSRGHDPTWPAGEFISSVEGAGAVRSIAGTTPAAGAEINEAVPTTARWRFKSFRFRLVTSAAVANRTVRVVLDDGVSTFLVNSFNFLQAASVTADYSVAIGVTQVSDATTGTFVSPIPDNLLFAGFRIRTATNLLQAADQFSILDYLVEEWIEL